MFGRYNFKYVNYKHFLKYSVQKKKKKKNRFWHLLLIIILNCGFKIWMWQIARALQLVLEVLVYPKKKEKRRKKEEDKSL